MADNFNSVVLGSGWLYAAPYKDISNPFALSTEDEAKLTNIGFIESNAKLVAKSKIVSAESANAGKVFNRNVGKEVSFQTGIISWNLDSVSKFLTGSDYTVDETTGKKTFLYANSDSAPRVFLRFIYTDETENKKITMDMFCGQFNSGLTLDFNNKNPVSFDYSFDLLAKDNGTKYVYFRIDEEKIS